MGTERVADSGLDRAVEPYPDGPAIAHRGHRRAAVHEPARIEAAHRSATSERHELGERDRLVPEGVGEQGGSRQAHHPSVVVEINEAAGCGAVANPPRARRSAEVISLLRLDLDSHPGSRFGTGSAAVERGEDMIVLGGVPAVEAVRQRKDSRVYLSAQAGVVAIVAVVKAYV